MTQFRCAKLKEFCKSLGHSPWFGEIKPLWPTCSGNQLCHSHPFIFIIHHSSPGTLCIVYFIDKHRIRDKLPIFKICQQLQVFFFRWNLLRDFFSCVFKMKHAKSNLHLTFSRWFDAPASPFSCCQICEVWVLLHWHNQFWNRWQISGGATSLTI